MHWQLWAWSLSGLRVFCYPGHRSLLMFVPRRWRRWADLRSTHHYVEDEWGGGIQALPDPPPKLSALGFASEGEREGDVGRAHGLAQIDTSRLHDWKTMTYMTI